MLYLNEPVIDKMGGVLAAIVFKSGDEELPPNVQDLQNIELLDIDG